MELHVVYRLYGGENMKGRPPYYSKRTSLASLLIAADRSSAEVVVLADGPLPDHLRTLAESGARVVDIPGGPVGMRRSYWAGLTLPDKLGWPDEDLVYFCEDDYLHRPDALRSLRRAAQDIAEADYFALYASTPRHPAFGPGKPFVAPKDWRSAPDRQVDGREWVNIPSTASTFAARLATLRKDLGIFRQGMLPYKTRLLDHETCLVVQGRFPYSAAELALGPANTRFRHGWRALASNVLFAPFRVAFEARALTRRRYPHLLYAADPNLACHLETEFMGPGVDWAALADEAAAWADSQDADRTLGSR